MDSYENITSSGAGLASYNSRYNTSKVFNLKDYGYVKTDGSATDQNLYLKGTRTGGSSYISETNALGMYYNNGYWGRAADYRSIPNSNSSAFYTKAGQDEGLYYNAFCENFATYTKNSIPFVPKNYGLIPIPDVSSTAKMPYSPKYTYAYTTYFRYDPKTDACYAGSASTNINTFLNNGPGIFFLMCGGGGGGGNSATTFAIFGNEGSGGGGGGGSSCFGYIDLRMYYEQGYYVSFSPGAGGKHPDQSSSENGGDGGSSCLTAGTKTIAICYGGKGGKGAGWLSDGEGGAGGECPTQYSSYIYLMWYSKGTNGGNGGNNKGGSLSSSSKVSCGALNDSDLPLCNNGTYGTGTDSYYTSDSDHNGGGGGASLLSRHSGFTPQGYGTGGYGGCYRNNYYWYEGCDGTTGAFVVLNVD